MIGINDELEIYGNKNNMSYNEKIGHIINDSASFTIDDENIDDITLKNIICKYVLNSNNNAVLKSNNDKTIYYIIAIKDINEGDEILMSYTPKFWINNKKLYRRFESLLINDINFNQFFLKIGIQKICNTTSILEALHMFM
jgi:SET domain-containing protein